MSREPELQRLLTRYADAIEAVVRRYADDDMERDDLRQEIAIAIWRAIPAFAAAASERTYVLRIAHNRAASFCVRRARRRTRFIPLSDDHTSSQSISGEFDVKRLAEQVSEAIGRLPVEQRELVSLASAGVPPLEIARRTGRTSGAVRVALHRARTAIRQWLSRHREES